MKLKRRARDNLTHKTARENETPKVRDQRQQKDWARKYYQSATDKYTPRYWTDVIENSPDDKLKNSRIGVAFFQRAGCYEQREKYKWALDDYREAVKFLIPNHPFHIMAKNQIKLFQKIGKVKNVEDSDGESALIDIDDEVAKREEDILENLYKTPIPEDSFADLFKAIVNIKNRGNQAMNDKNEERAYYQYRKACDYFDKLGLQFIDNFEENGYSLDQKETEKMILKAENACRVRLVEMSLNRGYLQEAYDHASYVVGTETGIKKAEYLLSLCHFKLNDFIEADCRIKCAEEEDPHNKDIYDLKNEIKTSLENTYAAIDEYTGTLKSEKHNIKVLFARAQCYYKVGYLDDYKKAFQDLQHVLNINPNHANALDWIKKIKNRLKRLRLNVPEIDSFEIDLCDEDDHEITDENESDSDEGSFEDDTTMEESLDEIIDKAVDKATEEIPLQVKCTFCDKMLERDVTLINRHVYDYHVYQPDSLSGDDEFKMNTIDFEDWDYFEKPMSGLYTFWKNRKIKKTHY